MKRSKEVTESRRRRLVVALLSGDPELDEVVRAGLDSLEADVLATDPGEAAAATADLWILDAANERVSIPSLLSDLASDRVLVLTDAKRASDPALAAAGYYLARPFLAPTLTALCQHILDRSEAERPGPEAIAEAEGTPRVTARPSLFSSRGLYADACRYVDEILADVRAGRRPRLADASILAEKIHTSLLQGNRLLLLALEPYERFELPQHSVNVALLAGKLATGLGWDLQDAHRAIQAGLLHDLGMARLPADLLNKQGKLTDEEWELVRAHPTHGAEIVAACGESYDWLRRAVLHEHERMNGQGYPAGLAGEEIDGLARVIAVADVFEAFSHPRTYRSLFTSYEALERVVGLRGDSLSGDIVAALVDEISAFPLDSHVLLSTGEIGRVVSTNPSNLMRPTVQTVWDPLWQPVESPRTLDLAEETSVSVSRPLHETELPIT